MSLIKDSMWECWVSLCVSMMRAGGERYLVPLLIVVLLTASLLYLYTSHTPLSLYTEDSSEVRLLMKKDVETWTEEETETFLQLKESQYSVMRERVRRFCNQGQVTLDPTSQSRNNSTLEGTFLQRDLSDGAGVR